MFAKQVQVAFMLISFSLSVIMGTEECLEKGCRCTKNDSQMVVNCQSLNLMVMSNFSVVPNNVVTIDFSKNRIESIPVLVEVSGLRTLSIHHNVITKISPGAFKDYTYLEYLDLSYNQVDDLRALEGLTGLKTLNLSHNVIRSVAKEFFSSMTELVELKLNGNPLHYVRYEMFRGLSRMSNLELSGCALSSLPDDVFHDMISLEELDISRNVFEAVPTSGLKSAQNLKKLKMNKIGIHSIESNAFKGCKHLESLELSDIGTLETIKTGAFSGLKLLKVLKISHNPQLKYLHFGAFEGLFSSLEDSTALQELILRENGLTEIKAPSMTLCRISTLDLQGNPWNCDCNLLWMTTCDLKDELTSDLKCGSPPRLEEKPIIQLGAEDMVCIHEVFQAHQEKALRVVAVSTGLVGVLFCIMVLLVVLRKRRIMEWWYYRKRGSGAVYYVKAKTSANDIRGGI